MDNKLIRSNQNISKHAENILELSEKLFHIDLRPLQILHLDDHLLYGKGVAICIKEKFPNVVIKNIQDGNEAIKYVEYSLQNNLAIDLIISDVNHPGLDGLSFCESVKKIEIEYSKCIPLIFLTMVDNIDFKNRMESLPFVKYFIKTLSCEEIKIAIENFT